MKQMRTNMIDCLLVCRFPAGNCIDDSTFPSLKHRVAITVDHKISMVSGLANRSTPSQETTLIASLTSNSLSISALSLYSSSACIVVSNMSKSEEKWKSASLNLVMKKGELYIPLISANTKRSGLISLNSFRTVSLGESSDTFSSGVYCNR